MPLQQTTIRVRKYVVKIASEKIQNEQCPLSLGVIVEQLLHRWISGSIDVGIKI